AIVPMLDLPHRDRRERRRADCLASAQIEAGVMPGATDAFARHDPFGERPVIVAAMRVNRKNPGAGACQQNFFVADMAEQRRSSKLSRGDALRQVRPCGRGLLIRHVLLRFVTSPFPGIPGASTRCRESSLACGWSRDRYPACGRHAWSCNDARP